MRGMRKAEDTVAKLPYVEKVILMGSDKPQTRKEQMMWSTASTAP